MTPNRRHFLLSAAALAGCRPQLARPVDAYVYIACQRARAISVVSLKSFKLVKEVPLDAEPTAVLVQAKTRRVFALTPSNGTVIELEGSSGTVVRKYRLAAKCVTMRFSPGGEAVWLLGRDPEALLRFDLATGRVVKTIKLSRPALDFDLSSAQPLAAAGTQLIHLQKGIVERPLDLEKDPGTIRFRPDGKSVLAAYPASRLISIADVATGGLVVNLPLPLEPQRFCFIHQNGGQMFVSGPGADAVVIVYPYQTVVDETILAGRTPGAMTIDNRDHFLFVANRESGELTVVTVAERRPIAKIAVGQEPNQILVTDDNQYCLTLNHGSSDLAVVRLSKLTEGRSLSDTRSRSALLFTVIPLAEGPVSAAICPLTLQA